MIYHSSEALLEECVSLFYVNEGLEDWIAQTFIFANELALLVVEMKPDLPQTVIK